MRTITMTEEEWAMVREWASTEVCRCDAAANRAASGDSFVWHDEEEEACDRRFRERGVIAWGLYTRMLRRDEV